jgi:hypothetical protein
MFEGTVILVLLLAVWKMLDEIWQLNEKVTALEQEIARLSPRPETTDEEPDFDHTDDDGED